MAAAEGEGVQHGDADRSRQAEAAVVGVGADELDSSTPMSGAYQSGQ
ncbi:hypothetical protein AB0C95_06610 [Streptomyces caniferus]